MNSKSAAWARLAGAGLLLLAGVSGTACAHAGAEAGPATSAASTPSTTAGGAIVVSSEDACPVVLAQNGTLELYLDGNPSTGYSWAVTNGATGVLTSRGEPSQQGESGVPGAPAQYVFRFDATTAGTGHLSLAYRQAWDTAAAPARTFECDVTVR